MMGRKQEINLQFFQILDGVLLVLAFWLAHVTRYSMTDWFEMPWQIPKFDQFRWLLFIIMPFGPILLEMHGYYVHPLQKTFGRSLKQIARAAIWLGLIVGGSIVFFRFDIPSRAVVLLFALYAVVFLMVREQLVLFKIRTQARMGRSREPVLLAGTPGDTARFVAELSEEQLIDMEIRAQIDIEKQPLADLVELLHQHSISRVIFAGSHTQMNRLQEAIGACETEGVEAWLVADFIKTSIARPSFDVLGSRPMLVFRTTPDVSWALMMKELMDRIGALVLLTLALPLMIAIAIGVRCSSPGPIIFRQKRGGRYGQPFTMYKFRTMRRDAEQARQELADRNEMSGPVFKVENDPRITPLGRWLRKTSVDELPQLFNVLNGSMSLVGPRPLPLYEVEQFENSAQRRRLSVKPGLTCLWQISGRNNVKNFQDWVRLDLDYIDNWSLWLDIKILFKTIPVVLFGLGAR
ncbi:MAG TPA: sugar transferase [Chthoniobacteraceae bacterium]|nr:sugar transferase [Chthoniobacteraceae bacterium]